MSETIRFYKVSHPWGCFSNFSRHALDVDGKRWPTSEHYFQAQKFVRTDPVWAAEIRRSERAGEAASKGRSRQHPLDSAWEDIKYHVMLVALVAKFTQHEDCKSTLLATGDAPLIEDTRQGKDDDHVWGDGSTGTGQNLLGEALMEVREALGTGTTEGLEEATREAIGASLKMRDGG